MRNYSLHTEIPFYLRVAAAIVYMLLCMFPESKFLENLRASLVKIIIRDLSLRLKKQNRTTGHVLQVERRTNLTEKEFIRDYMNKSVPVIFDKESLNWECTKKWTLDYFREQFGDKKLSLVESRGLVERELERSGGKLRVVVEEIRGKDFIDGIREGSGKYMRFGSLMESERQLISDLNLKWLTKMRRTFFKGSYLSFIGPAGRRTPMHAGVSAFFFVMADGEKNWALYSPASSALLRAIQVDHSYTDVNYKKPDPLTHPGVELLSRYECTVKKGDILWVPSWWWHEVENLTEGWGTRCGFANMRTFLRYPAFVFVRIFLVEPSLFKILYHRLITITSAQPSLIHPRFFTDD